MPRQLKNLRISEISSVDRGSGKGVRVTLLKSATQRNDDMAIEATIFKGLSALAPLTVAKRAHADVAAGEISDFRFAEIQKQLAILMFPNEASEGRALSKFFGTIVGKAMLAPRPALSAAQNYALMKLEAAHIPKPHLEQPDDDDDDPDEATTALNAMAAEHRQRLFRETGKRITHDAAVVHVIGSDEGNALFQRSKAESLRKNA
jgi:hypothetical protein